MSLILTGNTSGGTGTITYEWKDGLGNIISGGTTTGTTTVVVTSADTYTFTVTDDNGFTDTETFIVNDLTEDPTIDLDPISGELTFEGQTLVISAGTTTIGNPIYNWSTAEGNIISGETGSTITINSGGTYTLIVIDDYNGCSASDDSIITTNFITPPVARITGLTGLTCTATTITLSGNTSSGDGALSYQWSSTTETLGTASTQVVVSADTYYLYVIDTTNSLTSTTVNTVVSDITSTPVAVITSNGVDTLSVSDTFIVLSGSSTGVSGSTLYQWSGDTSGLLGTSPNQTVFDADTYHLTVTDDSNGCTGTTFTGITGSATVECSGTTAIISGVTTELSGLNPFIELSGGTSTSDNDLIYSWSAATQGVAVGDVSLTAVTVPDIYSLTVTDSINGCTGYTATTITQDLTPPVATITGGGVIKCNVSSVTLDGSTSTGNNLRYLWHNSTGLLIGTNVTLVVTDAMAPDSFYLTVIDENTLTDTSGLYPVTENKNAPTTVTAMADPQYGTVLTSANGFSLTFTGSYTGSGTFLDYWKRTGVSGTFSTDAVVTITEPGEYRYRVFDTTSFCGVWSDAITVTRVDTSTAVADIIGLLELNCSATTITLDGSGSSGALPLTYAWSATTQGVAVGDVSTTAVTTPDTYTLTITDNDSNVDSTTHTITEDIATPTATITPVAGTEIPEGGTLTLFGTTSTSNSGFWTYLWSNGSTSSSISISDAGTYTLTVTDPINDCTHQDSNFYPKEVATPTPVARITGDDEINCGTDEDVEDLGNILHIWTNLTSSAYSPQLVTNGSGTLLDWDVSGGLDWSEPIEGNPINDPSFNLSTNTGIAHLRGYDSIGVTHLTASGLGVTAFDITECPDMTHINFSNNKYTLTSVDLTQNTALFYINFSHCEALGAGCTNPVDFTQNVALDKLDINTCWLGNVDFSQNVNLRHLTAQRNCFSDPNMFVNCTSLTTFNLDKNQFVSLDTSNCPVVTYRVRNQSSFTTCDITSNPLISYFGITQTRVATMDFTNNLNLSQLHLWGNLYLNSYSITAGGSGVGSFGKVIYVNMHTTQLSADSIMADLEAYAPNGISATHTAPVGAAINTREMKTGNLIISPDWITQWSSARTSGSNTDFTNLRARGWNIYYFSSGLLYELTTTL